MALKKKIHELPAGTPFVWHDQKYIVNDNRIFGHDGKITDNITNGFVKVQQVCGGNKIHTWLADPEQFHADVEIIVPDVLEWLKS